MLTIEMPYFLFNILLIGLQSPDGFSRKQQAKSWQEVLTNVVNYLQGTEESRSATTKTQEEDKK